MPSMMKKKKATATRTVRILRNPRTKTFGFTLLERAGATPPATVSVRDAGKSTPLADSDALLRAGDVIVSVNKVSAEGWDMNKVADAIRKAGGDVLELEVRSPASVPAPAPSPAGGGGGISNVGPSPATTSKRPSAAAAAAAPWQGNASDGQGEAKGQATAEETTTKSACQTKKTPAAAKTKRAVSAAALLKTAEQNRRGQIIMHGSTIVLDEFDVPQIPITYDVETYDPVWYESYQSLVKLRNADVLSLRSSGLLLHWSYQRNHIDSVMPGMYSWIEEQRCMYANRRSILKTILKGGGSSTSRTVALAAQPTLAKIALLNDIHFLWLPQEECHPTVLLGSIPDTEWKSYYVQLVKCTSERGQCIVPSCNELGMWCGMQRAKRRGGTLDWAKVQAMNALGFDWGDGGDELSDWNGMRARLAQFKAVYGDCLVMPPREVDDPDAGTNRKRHGGGEKLGSGNQNEDNNDKDDGNKDDVGDEDEADEKTDEAGEHPKEGVNKDKEDEEDWSGLWWWVQCQRMERKRTQGCLLTPSHIASLDELDFIWSSGINAKWIRNFRKLKAYAAEHRAFHLPMEKELRKFIKDARSKCQKMKKREEKKRADEENSKSGSAEAVKLPVRDWRNYGTKNCSLTPAAIRLLDSISFPWVSEIANLSPLTWEEKFEELRQYKERTGNCHVHQQDPSLGGWVKTQRKLYAVYQEGKHSCMTEGRIRKLEKLGFLWRIRGKRGKGLQREETLKDARESWKSARQKRRSMEEEAEGAPGSCGAAKHDGGSSGNENEVSSTHELPTQDNAIPNARKKQKLQPSQDPSTPACATERQENARRGIVHTLKCRVCSDIVLRSTLCLPCGHSFCASCIDMSAQCACPRCHAAVSTLAPQRDMDEIVALSVQRGDFDAEDVNLYERRLRDSVTV